MALRTPLLSENLAFPEPNQADRHGLVAVGGDLSVERLLLAYRVGVFPWTDDPITWWSPDPRAIFELDQFHVPRSLARTLRKNEFQVTFDQDFENVIRACADSVPGRRSTWISSKFITAYSELHRQDHAHSVECWLKGALVGGVYGVAIGGLFAGESMFHKTTDASKVALFFLINRLSHKGYSLFDIQMLTPVTALLGAVEIRRKEYLRRLAEAIKRPCRFGSEAKSQG
jgi:leucyl/phenylalanyl-tRNA--protein transferase